MGDPSAAVDDNCERKYFKQAGPEYGKIDCSGQGKNISSYQGKTQGAGESGRSYGADSAHT